MEEDSHKRLERLSASMPVICNNEEDYWNLMNGVATHLWIEVLQDIYNPVCANTQAHLTQF